MLATQHRTSAEVCILILLEKFSVTLNGILKWMGFKMALENSFIHWLSPLLCLRCSSVFLYKVNLQPWKWNHNLTDIRNYSFRSVTFRSDRYHHSHCFLEAVVESKISLYSSHCGIGNIISTLHLCPDTIALASIPVAGCQIPMPTLLQHLPPLLLAHLAHLSLWQCPPLLPQSQLSWQGALYILGQPWRQSFSRL